MITTLVVINGIFAVLLLAGMYFGIRDKDLTGRQFLIGCCMVALAICNAAALLALS